MFTQSQKLQPGMAEWVWKHSRYGFHLKEWLTLTPVVLDLAAYLFTPGLQAQDPAVPHGAAD